MKARAVSIRGRTLALIGCSPPWRSSIAVTIIVQALSFTTGCTHGRPWHAVAPREGANQARPRTVGDAPSRPPNDQFVDAAQLEALLCGEGEPCCFWGGTRVGQDAKAQDLAVITMRRGACEPQESPVESSGGFCEDYLLVVLGAADRAPRWLGSKCGDRWDEITTSADEVARTFTYSYSARIATGRIAGSVSIGLEPLRLAAMSSSTSSTSFSRDAQWNWDTFSGSLDVGVDYCSRKKAQDATPALHSDALRASVSAVAIPRVTLPAAFVDGGWRTVSPGDCAARVDGAENGFSIQGPAGTAADAMFRAVLSDSNDLFIELEDDHFVGGAGGLARADHLQIWTAAWKECVDPTAPPSTTEWTIRVIDGDVLPGFGRPTRPPSVESVRDDHRVRMKVGLARSFETNDSLTVVYSDSDDGVQAKRRIATSQLVPGKWWTLGTWYDPFADPFVELKIRRPAVACEITATKLSDRKSVV